MIRVGITGVPGAGKTTLSRSLASKCRSIESLKKVELIQEYARRYLLKHGSITSILEQYRILEKQTEWENSVCNSELDIMITDSPLFLGFVYCCDLPKNNSKEVAFFNDVFKKMVKLNYPDPRYDIIFHLCPTHKPVNDGVRSAVQFNDLWREKTDLMIRATMSIFKPKQFIIVEPTDMDKRLEFCINCIERAVNA